MTFREFWREWREYGLRTTVHNWVWLFVHRDDERVMTWQKGDDTSKKPEEN